MGEAAEGTISVRSRTAGDLGPRTVADFIAAALEETARKAPAADVAPA